MKTYSIKKDRVSYLPAFDVLYIGYGDNSLECCDKIEDVEPGISIMMKDGEFSGAEIYDFKRSFGTLPAQVLVNAEVPFVLDIPSI